MINAFADAAQLFADRGVHKDVAVLFQADPLSAEIGLRDNLFHLGRSTLSGVIESFDFGPSVEVEGKKYTKTEPTTGHAITTLGSVKYQRLRYRATNRQGESFIPAEHLLYSSRTSAWIDRRQPDAGGSRFVNGAPQQPDRT